MSCNIDKVFKENFGKDISNADVQKAMDALRSRARAKKNKGKVAPADHSDFKDQGLDDVYSTPVPGMKAGIKMAMAEVDLLLNPEIKDKSILGSAKVVKALRDAAPIAKLFDKFGPDENNDGLWRKMMKPLVMVYIYGAQISSIRTKAGREFGMFAVDKAIKSLGDISYGEFLSMAKGKFPEEFPEKGKAEARETAIMLKAVLDGVQGNLKFVEFSSLTNSDVVVKPDAIVKARMKDLYLSDDQIFGISWNMSTVIGDSIESSFDDSFGFIDDYRKSLKNVEMINYSLYKYELKKKLMKYVDANGVLHVSNEVLDTVYAELNAEGKFLGAKNARGNIQDYMKYDSTEKGQSGITGRSWDGSKTQKGVSKSLAVVSKELMPNPGAVGVTAIHDMDGFLMYLTNNDDFQNIFDAYIVGLDMEKGLKTSDSYNFNVIDLSRQHSILHNSVEKVSGQLKELKKDPEAYKEFLEGIRVDEMVALQEAYHVIDTNFNGDSIEAIKDMLENIDMNRDRNINGDVVSGQMHVSSAFPALRMEKDTEVEGKKSKPSKQKFADFSDIEEVLEVMVETVSGVKVEKKTEEILTEEVVESIGETAPRVGKSKVDSAIISEIIEKFKEC